MGPSRWWTILVALGFAVLAGCGGSSSGGGGDSDEPTVESVGGNATKGPLANADVTVFELDPSAERMRGEEVATGVTNDAARIQVELAEDVAGTLIVAVEANDGTTDITTGEAPILGELSTVTTADDWRDDDEPVYATPLSHMAVEIAARNVPDDAGVAQARSGLSRAQSVVRETVGFDLLVDDDGDPIDLFSTAPILEPDADDAGRTRALRYRRATEAVGAVLAEVEGDDGNVQARFDSVLEDLADGSIGEDNSDVVEATETTDPDDLTIPGTERTVSETRDIVNEEREQVAEDDEEPAEEATEEEDTGDAGSARADSGLTAEDLEGAVSTITLEVDPADGGTARIPQGEPDPEQEGVFEVGAGDSVELNAEPSGEGYFWRWLEDGNEQGTGAELSLDIPNEDPGPRTFTAELAVGVDVQADPGQAGAPALADGETSARVSPGETVTLEAGAPNDGFEFAAWVDSDLVELSTSESFEFTIPEQPTVVTAQYDFVAAQSEDTSEGNVTTEFDDDGNAVLTADPGDGFVFVGWVDQDGNTVGTNPDEFVLDQADFDQTIEARFADESSGDDPTPAIWDEFDWGDAVWQ